MDETEFVNEFTLSTVNWAEEVSSKAKYLINIWKMGT